MALWIPLTSESIAVHIDVTRGSQNYFFLTKIKVGTESFVRVAS